MSLEDQLQALEAAIHSGHKEIRFDGRTIVYRDMDELIAARNDLLKELSAEQLDAKRIPLAGRTWLATQSGRGL